MMKTNMNFGNNKIRSKPYDTIDLLYNVIFCMFNCHLNKPGK